MYRRRRLVAAGVLAAAAFTAGVLLTLVITARPARGALTDDARQAEHTTHVVAPGDTLWSIASTLEPGRDPRPVVDAIAGSRGSATVRPGEVITWPIE